jgi:hypothetical protein
VKLHILKHTQTQSLPHPHPTPTHTRKKTNVSTASKDASGMSRLQLAATTGKNTCILKFRKRSHAILY